MIDNFNDRVLSRAGDADAFAMGVGMFHELLVLEVMNEKMHGPETCPFCGEYPYEIVAAQRVINCCRAGDMYLSGRATAEVAQAVYDNPNLFRCWSCREWVEYGAEEVCPKCGKDEIPF
jgi:predicted RNA-binding Zn-ribbon protein involved in translation (DUF1610 family)